jgi:hypothetical protein
MKKYLGAALAAALFLLGARPCAASFMLSLSSPTPSLGALTIGQTVTVDVVLSGSPGDTVPFLGTTVNYDGALLGPSTVTPGAIIPYVQGFSSSPPGPAVSAVGQYDDTNLLYDCLNPSSGPQYFPPISLPISGNGVLFSFTTQATAAGTGTFSFADTVASDNQGNLLSVSAGLPLGFTVASPEPSAWLLAVLGGATAFVFSWAPRRRVEGSTA